MKAPNTPPKQAPDVSLPPDLDRALGAHADGEALRQLWTALPGRASAPRGSRDAATRDDATREDATRDAAWAALAARIADPARVPYDHDVTVEAPVLTLYEVEHDAPEHDAPDAVSLSTAVPSTVSSTRVPWSPARRSRPRSMRLVTGLVAGLAATLGIMIWRAVPASYAGASGVTATGLTLADGSQVWLTEGATLTVPRALGWPAMLRSRARDVTLTGTAFFAVAKDGRAFAVRTPDAVVQVLGTRFEVRARAAGSRVAVEEGHVSVTALASQARVELRAGDATQVAGARLPVTRVATERVGSWREGGLAALDEPLREVLAELERRYHREITLEPDVPADAPVSLFYPRAPALDSLLADLCTAQGLRFRQTSRGYVIMRGPGPA